MDLDLTCEKLDWVQMIEYMAHCGHLGVGLIYCKLPRKNSALNNLSIVSLYLWENENCLRLKEWRRVLVDKYLYSLED